MGRVTIIKDEDLQEILEDMDGSYADTSDEEIIKNIKNCVRFTRYMIEMSKRVN